MRCRAIRRFRSVLCRVSGTRSSRTEKVTKSGDLPHCNKQLCRLATICMSNCSGLGLHPIQEAKSPMSIQEHLVELKARHRALEDEIADALAHPSTDDSKIAELKRRKLQVKDEIARMQASASVH